MSEVLKITELTIIPNLFMSIETINGNKYFLAALNESSETFVNGFDEENNKIVSFPREQVLKIEFYSILDEENK